MSPPFSALGNSPGSKTWHWELRHAWIPQVLILQVWRGLTGCLSAGVMAISLLSEVLSLGKSAGPQHSCCRSISHCSGSIPLLPAGREVGVGRRLCAARPLSPQCVYSEGIEAYSQK